jgi:hypothetical protein
VAPKLPLPTATYRYRCRYKPPSRALSAQIARALLSACQTIYTAGRWAELHRSETELTLKNRKESQHRDDFSVVLLLFSIFSFCCVGDREQYKPTPCLCTSEPLLALPRGAAPPSGALPRLGALHLHHLPLIISQGP